MAITQNQHVDFSTLNVVQDLALGIHVLQIQSEAMGTYKVDCRVIGEGRTQDAFIKLIVL